MTNDKQKDRLVELLEKASEECINIPCNGCKYVNERHCKAQKFVDRILADGWMRPPCKVGDTVYFLHRFENYITEHKVDNFYVGKKGMSIRISGVMHPVKPYEFGRIFFNSKEEAEAKLEEGVQG